MRGTICSDRQTWIDSTSDRDAGSSVWSSFTIPLSEENQYASGDDRLDGSRYFAPQRFQAI